MNGRLRAAAEAALKALEEATSYTNSQTWSPSMTRDCEAAINALCAALAEPEVEPVAWMDIDENGNRLTVRQWSDGNKEEVPLYTYPSRREWVGLTDDDIDRVTDAQWARNNDKPIYAAYRAYARAVEEAIREKNG